MKAQSNTKRYKQILRKQGKQKKLAPKYRKRLLRCKDGERHLRFF